jgi:hypothetical protein
MQHSFFCYPVSKHVMADSTHSPWQDTTLRQHTYNLLQSISKRNHSHPRISVAQNTWGKTTVYEVHAITSVSWAIRPVDQQWMQDAIEKSDTFTTYFQKYNEIAVLGSPQIKWDTWHSVIEMDCKLYNLIQREISKTAMKFWVITKSTQQMTALNSRCNTP